MLKAIVKNNFTIIFILLALAAVFMRADWYGDLRLSIANSETVTYIKSSRAPLWSWKIFSGPRLFTTNLIFKTANDEQKCPVTAYSTPALGREAVRADQACFDTIALLQNFLSMFGWIFLAWTTSKWMHSPFTKIVAALVIMAFGFTPQIAEWDSLLSPESLSLSLFAIAFGLMQELFLRVSSSEVPFKSRSERVLLMSWLIVFLLWIFVRDVHLYALPITLALSAPFFLLKRFRSAKLSALTFAILLVFFTIGFMSARDSLRATRYPLINALDARIWPYPERVRYFEQFGMPDRLAGNYQEWADADAAKAYGLFLVSHPGFVAVTLWENMDQFSSDFIQPYFFTPEVKHRDSLITVGQMLHPETPAVYLISLIILFSLLVHTYRQRTPTLLAWTWLAVWFFAIAAVTLVLSFLGDIEGTRRHIMPSVELFRLFFWIFLLPLLDLPFSKHPK